MCMIAKISLIKKIPTGDTGCSNLSSIASNGNELWVCKVGSSDSRAIIYHCPNISSASPTLDAYPVVTNMLGHASGMTCNSNYLLIGCKQPPKSADKYICRIPLKAVPTGKYGSYKVLTNSLDLKVGAIASYKSYRVIVRHAGASKVKENGYDEFWILRFTVDFSEDARYTKYEVESATLDADRYLILGCNIEGEDVSDAIVRVTNRTW